MLILGLGMMLCPTAIASTVSAELILVIVEDLVPKPVPLADLSISPIGDPSSVQTIRTDLNGKVILELEPGDYLIVSTHPVVYRGDMLSWRKTVTIRTDGQNTVTLTDADAERKSAAKPVTGARQVSDEAKVYEQCGASVVALECDQTSGSGFLVSTDGLILTNQHVVNETIYVAVRFRDGKKCNAIVVEQDPEADVAVVWVNPSIVDGLEPLPLVHPVDGTVAVTGEKVLAIGSPLHQENILTVGIVSKVEKDVLISDVNINHGNSGGPLLNLAGDVIGITTFGDVPDQSGPGISGIVCIERAKPVLEKARQKLAETKPPAIDLLPVPSDVPIPVETLNEAASRELKPIGFRAPANFEGFVLTPFILASQQAAYDRELLKYRNKRAKDRGKEGERTQHGLEPKRFWERYAISDLSGGAAVVALVFLPKAKETRGSFIGGMVSTVLLGGRVNKANYKYRDDFYDMELYRGDNLILPVRRARITRDMYFDGVWVKAKDIAMGGIYFYDPSAFAPGEKITLKVRKESNLEKWSELDFNTKMQATIWNSFASWREAVSMQPKSQDVTTN